MLDEAKSMKVLDVDLFQEGLQRNIIMLDRLSSEMEAINDAVKGLVQMEDQLKGAGGNAIRSFYQECHLPLLYFFQSFSEQFKQVLSQMEAAARGNHHHRIPLLLCLPLHIELAFLSQAGIL